MHAGCVYLERRRGSPHLSCLALPSQTAMDLTCRIAPTDERTRSSTACTVAAWGYEVLGSEGIAFGIEYLTTACRGRVILPVAEAVTSCTCETAKGVRWPREKLSRVHGDESLLNLFNILLSHYLVRRECLINIQSFARYWLLPQPS